MSFLTPIMLLLGLLVIPVIALYLLRLRRKEVVVSSTILWQRLLRDRQANAPWQRLRRNILLLLQLIILTLLVLALARPILPFPSIAHGNVVVLLDGSASMLASDQSPNRFAAAKSEVERLISELGSQDQMTLIQVGRTPKVLASTSNDKSHLRSVLAEAQPGLEFADWPAALALASGASQGFQDPRIIIVSDGGLTEDIPPVTAEIVFVRVGEKAENMAISHLASRRTADGEQLFVSLTNHGPDEAEAIFNLELNGQLFDSQRVEIPAVSSINLTKDVPDGSDIIEAYLSENSQDFLSHDDRAWTVSQQNEDIRVLLVSQGNHFLETVYSVLPGVQLFLVQPDQLLSPDQTEQFDIIVYDRVPPAEDLPRVNLFFIDPSPPVGDNEQSMTGLFSVDTEFENTQVIQLSNDPLMDFVDWGNVNVRRAKLINAPWARSLVSGEGGPLLLSGEYEGRRVVILPFSLQESDLALQIAFPVLMANITSWLGLRQPVDDSDSLIPGEPISIKPDLRESTIVVVKPDGETWISEVGSEPTIFAETTELGVYEVRYRDNSGEIPAGHFAVNLIDAEESRIEPRESLRIGQIEVTRGAKNDVGQRELWSWLVAATLAILILEWWIYHRGTKVPEISSWRQLLLRFRN